MKLIFKIASFLLVCYVVASCDKTTTDYKNLLQDHEITYPGKVGGVTFRPGNQRAQLLWHPSTDPNVAKYVVVYNNGADSVVLNATSHNSADTVKVTISNLSEYVYSFFIYSYDAPGNRSVPLEVNNVKIYGSIYSGALLNRAYNAGTPYIVNDDGSVQLNFNTPDTININTSIKYTNNNGSTIEKFLLPTSNSILLDDYKAGTTVTYRSSFVPVLNALDTFYTAAYDTFPTIYKFVQCDKSIFQEIRLPNDVGTYSNETTVSKLWDGSVGPQGYPNIWHSDGDHPMPHHFTFDMGKVYPNLSTIEETGRNCCNNPDDFEVWGISDLTNAETTLPGNDAGWAAESITKGWTLLKEVVRTDDGQNAFKADFISNPPPVRYIRIRVKHVTTNSAESANISEMTFWNKE